MIVTDFSTPPFANAFWIDALISEPSVASWNWLVPTRNTVVYTFNVSSDLAASVAASSSATVPFNGTQQAAARQILAYVESVTGIGFVETGMSDADLSFGSCDITDPTSAGIAASLFSYNFNPSDGVVTSSTVKQHAFLDNLEYQSTTNAPVAGNAGYEVLLHEIGHTLGLKHPFEGSHRLPSGLDNTSETVMSYTDSGGPYSQFNELDLAALDYLYGLDGVGGSWGVGTSGAYYTGTSAADAVNGTAGGDAFSGRAGNDAIAGFGGIDMAIYQGGRSGYTLARSGGSWSVTDSTSTRDGSDTLAAIERLKFTDIGVALDLDGAAGMTAKILGAVFGREYVQSRDFVGIGLSLFDSGMSYEQVAGLAAGTSLFAQLAGSHSNRDFVNYVYKNVVGTLPSDSELAFYTGLLDSGAHTQASLAVLAADTVLNQQSINLVGLQQSGLEFI